MERADEAERLSGLMESIGEGDAGALDELVALLYPELKRLAHVHLVRERQDHTLNTTAIVHEAFVRLAAGNNRWNDRGHFLCAASRVMRHLLVDHARRRNAEKRGSGIEPLELSEHQHEAEDGDEAVLALDRALHDLAAIDPRLVQIIECRYFAGLTVNETAEALNMAVRTVERDWQRARGYLVRAMQPDER